MLRDMPPGLSTPEQRKWKRANSLLPAPKARAAKAAAPTIGTEGVTLADMLDGLSKLEALKWKANGLHASK